MPWITNQTFNTMGTYNHVIIIIITTTIIITAAAWYMMTELPRAGSE
jgi:hypothetical protein